MIFSELYSIYYNTMAKVLEVLVAQDVLDNKLQMIRTIVAKNAFGESAMAFLPAIQQERWQIVRQDFTTAIRHKPTMPLTTLQKQWLKAVLVDPRVRLFGIEIDGLDDVSPLFTSEDYCIYDQYTDGDPFKDPEYIRNFRLILNAIKTRRPIQVIMDSQRGNRIKFHCYPKHIEYSEKDDKFRVIAEGNRYEHFNIARIVNCDYYDGNTKQEHITKKNIINEVTLLIRNERNTLERVMMHFAHFEKRAERLDDDTHRVSIKYYVSDETEMVIRILSFGPLVKVLEPETFVDLIKERLIRQKACELN